jgi:hypothetical protein
MDTSAVLAIWRIRGGFCDCTGALTMSGGVQSSGFKGLSLLETTQSELGSSIEFAALLNTGTTSTGAGRVSTGGATGTSVGAIVSLGIAVGVDAGADGGVDVAVGVGVAVGGTDIAEVGGAGAAASVVGVHAASTASTSTLATPTPIPRRILTTA